MFFVAILFTSIWNGEKVIFDSFEMWACQSVGFSTKRLSWQYNDVVLSCMTMSVSAVLCAFFGAFLYKLSWQWMMDVLKVILVMLLIMLAREMTGDRARPCLSPSISSSHSCSSSHRSPHEIPSSVFHRPPLIGLWVAHPSLPGLWGGVARLMDPIRTKQKTNSLGKTLPDRAHPSRFVTAFFKKVVN